MKHLRALCVAGAAAVALSAPGHAADLTLPDQLVWTAYDTGSSGYAQSVAIGAAMQDATGTNLRILPGKNDIARMEPVRQGKAPFSAMGVGIYMLQEGVFEFGTDRWGPQSVRLVAMNNSGEAALAVGVAKDVGVETYADLKGKRVAYVKGAPALNVNMEAYLAYGGLTWDDVEVVEFGGYGDSWKGMVNGDVDAAYAIMTSGSAFQMEASPRGLMWPHIDPNNKEGLDRMLAIAPYFQPVVATKGAVAATTEGGIPSAAYPYPVLIAYADQDEELVYNQTKAMFELYDQYAGKAPGIDGWAMKYQNFEWVVPYHDGAIRYFKEAGAWTDAAQAHNDALIQRQKVLQDAWAALEAQKPADWEAAWAEARRKALTDAGLSVVF
ncbi:TAXI family TRAP transporter solute-binding subunit [Albimonas sp. CAU 1670]|uniref:TAXI family TRAP transporter solute-binding subunit n=1 Tax=Albimonas sp. CAU 1670 TaxID=3032599 RepID=UPI0023DA77E4|nr:TAXI family TRAP transporter solute-binding subunit [Albimonas sp. CAU 1670]MDF2233903.1 TAXI family TRAP transporter solute-binding subunit [Albimonas sp. CAU 1670]